MKAQQVVEIKAQLDEAKRKLARMRELFAGNLVSAEQVTKAEAELARLQTAFGEPGSQASLAAARQKLEAVERDLVRTKQLKDQNLLSQEQIAKATEEDLRACGLSNAKIRTLRALAQAIAEDGLDLVGLGGLDAEDAHNALVAVKGVGPWTADVFLLFCLGHPDAFPAGNVALQEAAKLALNLKRRPDAERLERIAERWRPLRGVAARMLWAYYRGVKARSGMALADASR